MGVHLGLSFCKGMWLYAFVCFLIHSSSDNTIMDGEQPILNVHSSNMAQSIALQHKKIHN